MVKADNAKLMGLIDESLDGPLDTCVEAKLTQVLRIPKTGFSGNKLAVSSRRPHRWSHP
jgi:hypothetical protein